MNDRGSIPGTSIPGPTDHPTIQLIRWLVGQYSFLDQCAAQFGDCFMVRWGGFPPFVMLSDPAAIKQVFANSSQFDAGRSNVIMRPVAGSFSLVLLDGEEHQRQRKFVLPSFHRERMQSYSQTIAQITHQMIDEWQPGEWISVPEQMRQISFATIFQCCLESSPPEWLATLKVALSSWIQFLVSPMGGNLLFFPVLQQDFGKFSPWGWVKRQQKTIDQLLFREIERRRSTPNPGDRNDILEMLMEMQDEDGHHLTKEELRDQMITLLVGGYESSALAMAWLLYWVHYLPEVKARVQDEIDALSLPEGISQAPYLKAVCQESLRLYPVAPFAFPRIASQAIKIGEREFPEGTYLVPCIYLAHRHPAVFPNPTQFRPERFLERTFQPHEFLPFGGGNRRCIGQAFVLHEMQLVVAVILKRCQLILENKPPMKPKRRGLNFGTPNSFRLRVAKR